ncbi:hypothetical protein F5I97DRAFT_1926738 [Phlebopus sp. FC_14]|nr:hypothetical protein F5I97DRAFT_1926738 [Phlebopus sp. FC_14]
MLALTESILYFFNITPNHSPVKASFQGLIKNWASVIVPSAGSKEISSCITANVAPSRAPLTITHTSSTLIPSTPVNSVVETSSIYVAGLKEGEDNTYEHSVSIRDNVKGEDARKSLLSIADEGDIMLPLFQKELVPDHTGVNDPTMEIDSDIELIDTDFSNAPLKFNKSIGCLMLCVKQNIMEKQTILKGELDTVIVQHGVCKTC